MDDKKFHAVLMLLVPQIVQLITEQCSLTELNASKAFYKSGVYALLEQEDTKLWHFSPLTLFHMFCEEKESGQFDFPEEAL